MAFGTTGRKPGGLPGIRIPKLRGLGPTPAVVRPYMAKPKFPKRSFLKKISFK